MKQFLQLEPRHPHQVLVKPNGVKGYIRYWVPECINANAPGYDPQGVCIVSGNPEMRKLDRIDAIEALQEEARNKRNQAEPLLWKRGPILQLKMETPDERTAWVRHSEKHFELSIIKPNVFEYRSSIIADNETVSVEATLKNISSWDWRDAYVLHCCGVDQCPSLTDHAGERTFILTAEGLVRLADTKRVTWPDFRATAQYYEPQDKPIPRTEDGFAFDECGINEKRVTAGLVLRQSVDGQFILVAAARKYQATFFDLGYQNNCMHTNPLAGDLTVGQTLNVNSSIHLAKNDIETAVKMIEDRYNIPAVNLRTL